MKIELDIAKDRFGWELTVTDEEGNKETCRLSSVYYIENAAAMLVDTIGNIERISDRLDDLESRLEQATISI